MPQGQAQGARLKDRCLPPLAEPLLCGLPHRFQRADESAGLGGALMRTALEPVCAPAIEWALATPGDSAPAQPAEASIRSTTAQLCELAELLEDPVVDWGPREDDIIGIIRKNYRREVLLGTW